jgi:hypothetical protein
MLFQSCETIGKEAFAPKRDHFTASVQTRGNLVVGHAGGCVENHLGSLNLKIRQRIFSSSPVQLGALGRREADFVGARSWQGETPHHQDVTAMPRFQAMGYVSVFLECGT